MTYYTNRHGNTVTELTNDDYEYSNSSEYSNLLDKHLAIGIHTITWTSIISIITLLVIS